MKESKQRFVREYANWKISLYKELAKEYPDNADSLKADIDRIRQTVTDWERGYIMTNEVMGVISKI